jgi:hypothetical protein
MEFLALWSKSKSGSIGFGMGENSGRLLKEFLQGVAIIVLTGGTIASALFIARALHPFILQ